MLTIFSNHINHLESEIRYYESLISEKRARTEKLEGIQGKVATLLGLAEEIKEDVAAIDARHLETVRAELDKIFEESPGDPPRHLYQQQADLDSQSNDERDNDSDHDGGVKPSLSPQPNDGGSAASEDSIEPEPTVAEESTNASPVDWSNNYMNWCQTDNRHFAYFKRKHDGAVAAAFIGSNNRARLKSWETYIKNLIPGVSFEIRSNSKDIRLTQFKHELKIWNLTESDCKQLAEKNFDYDPEFFAPKGDSDPSTKGAIQIDESQLPTGCFLRRSDDWVAIEYYVYIYEKKFDPKEHGFVIDTRKIGRLIQHTNYISAWRNRASVCGEFDNTWDAINYLLSSNGISREDIAKAYYERFPEELKTPYGICKCGTPFDIPGLDARHCLSCGWVRSDDLNNQPEQTHPVAATVPESIAPESTAPLEDFYDF